MRPETLATIFRWPVVTEDVVAAAQAQMLESVSIYDEGGIFGDFERAFANRSGHAFGLCTSSGTAALHSAFYGLGCGSGDEIIACDFGFFATVSPAVYLGTTIRFVDCTKDGCLDASKVESAITSRTKAVVVTHMWGAAGPVKELRKICDEHGLSLIEDCSHAHGTTVEGHLVGGFGDVAVWSLQAKKPLWAGEGGILCTSNEAVFERALLLGHFNVRAMNQIARDSANWDLAFTGTGLKYRAHPVGIAMAMCQLAKLDELIEGRQEVASTWADNLESNGQVRVLSRSLPGMRHSYYSLVSVLPPSVSKAKRRELAAELVARGILGAGVPRQMVSMSGLPLFKHQSSGQMPCSTAEWIGDNCINIFVPSLASPNVSEELVQEAAFVIAEVMGKFVDSNGD